jgi:hypothetical protein
MRFELCGRQPDARLIKVARQEIFDGDTPDPFAGKEKGKILPLPFCHDGNPIDAKIQLHLTGQVAPIAALFPTLEILGDNKKPGAAMSTEALSGDFLSLKQLGLSQTACDLDGHNPSLMVHNFSAHNVPTCSAKS